MRLLQTEITPLISDSIHVELRDQPFLWSPFHSQPTFHSHPELELVFVVEGFGKRIIGNKVEPFEAGDMVFIGSNVSHIWLSDPLFYQENSCLQSKVIVTYFNTKMLQFFDSLKEFETINEMIKQSSKGIKIFGETRNIIAEELIKLSHKQGYEKVDGFLRIMNLISVSDEKSFIVNEHVEYHEDKYSDKLISVVSYLKNNLHKQITLKKAADIACMTEQSFCRFFKKRTKKSFSHYLNDIRITYAKELLIQSDKSIGDIAYLCGYSSDSHFCRIFKDHVGESPFKYKSFLVK